MSRDLIFVALSLLTWGIGESAFIAFQPLYLQNLGANPIQIGVIYGAYGFAASLIHIPAGYLSDRIGRRPLMWAAWIIGVLAAGIMALAPTLPWFVAGMLLYGSTMFVVSPMNSYVTAARGRFSVGRALTLVSATYSAGVVLGPLFGGYIGERFGIRSIFAIAAVIFVLSTILILFIRPQPLEHLSHAESGSKLFANRRYLAFLPVFFLFMFSTYLPQPLSPNYLQNARGLGLTDIGKLYSVNGLGVVVLNLVLGQLDARLGFLLGQVFVGAFAVLLWQGSGSVAYILGYFFLGGFRTTRLMGLAQIRPVIRNVEMGLAYGLIETSGAIAMLLAAPLAGYLYDRNPVSVYSISIILIGVSIITSLVYSYNKRSRQIELVRNIEESSP
jgi:DHA1 family multidrug resistance protein-like MFS transporter